MKIYFLTSEPFPNGNAATNRIKCFCRSFNEAGLDCELLVFRRTEKAGTNRGNDYGEGVDCGIKYRYIGGHSYRSPIIVGRILMDALDFFKTLFFLRSNIRRGDIVFFYSGLFCKQIQAFTIVAHRCGAVCVRDFCEHPAVFMKNPAIVLEKQLPRMDGIISISESLMEVAKRYSNGNCRHLKVPILVDYDSFELPDMSSLEQIPYIFHSGLISEQKDGFLGMLEAFGMACSSISRKVMFISTGRMETSEYKDDIQKIMDKYNMSDRVVFVGYLHSEQIREYLSKASLVISNKYRTMQNEYGFSTKLGEYSAAGKIIIMTEVGEAMNYFKDGQTAIVVPPSDNEALSNAIVRAFSHPEELKVVSDNCRKLCKSQFDYKNWALPLSDFLNGISMDSNLSM